MKTLFSFIVALAFCIPAFAQRAREPVYVSQTIPNMPATVAAASSTNVGIAASPPVIDTRNQQQVAVEFAFTMSAAGASNVYYTFVPSVSGTYYNTNRPQTLNGTCNGTSVGVISTNLQALGYGYWKIWSISNEHATATMTNTSSKYSLKINAP